MIDALPYIGGIGGIASLLGVILMYFKWKPKHPVEVKAAEVKIQAEQIHNENEIIEQYRKEYANLKSQLDEAEETIKKIKDELDEERRARSEQEGECDKKIAQLRQELHAEKQSKEEILKQMHAITTRCKNNCFTESEQRA